MMGTPVRGAWALAMLCVVLPVPAHAEWYVAGHVGGAFPHALTNVEEDRIPQPTTPSGTKATNLSMSRSIMVGGKVGYFFESIKWLGIEGELYRYSPNFKQQNVTETEPNGTTTTTNRPGWNHLVSTLALNVVTRLQMGQWEPYAGVGIAAIWQQWNMRHRENNFFPLSISSGRAGFNAEAGLRYRFQNHFALFSEWKFNHVGSYFDSPANVQGNFDIHFLTVGVGYHF